MTTTVIVGALLCLAALNIQQRASWSEMEDGVLWRWSGTDVVASEIAHGTAADRAGLQAGDVLLMIDGRPVERVEDVVASLHASARGAHLRYTILRIQAKRQADIEVAPVPSSPLGLYFALAAVGVFSLLVGASVRLRRPDHQATLHFFWLTVAFFGMMAFSFTGKLDALDWTFYWGDLTAQLLLPPLFLHFALVFPDRPDAWVRSDGGRSLVSAIYLPALLLGAVSVAGVINGAAHGEVLTRVAAIVQQGQLVYLAASLVAGLAIMVRALREVRSVTARRQLRWIVWGTALGSLPFVFGYALPFAFGLPPLRGFEFSALLLGLIPLAFASAIVRYRLMDVEVIIKRGLVYAAALAAIAAIYAILLRTAGAIFLRDDQKQNPVIALLATFVVVLLSRPVKNAIQAGLDRVYYRDRYDYRRALVGFARDLNSDLDLLRLSERLVHRVMETLLVDRMALMLAPVSPDGGDFVTISHAGFADAPPPLTRTSEVSTRLISGHTLALDETLALRRLDPREVEFWRESGIHYFVPCVSKEGTIAVMALGRKASAEPLSSEDMALLSAVAAQAATALENGRLYRQLRTKADELERMRQFSENILESLNDGLAVLDRNGRVVRWNRQLEELYGVRHEAAAGLPLDELFEPGIVRMIRGSSQAGSEGTAHYRVPMSTRHEPSRRLLVNIGATPLRDSHAAVVGTILIVEDISTRVQLEEQLQISEKMASIGLLAAGVAHEVNTPLTGISSFTQMLLEGADPEDPKTRLLEKIERQTFRAAKIVNGLLNLSRPGTSSNERIDVDLNAVITDVFSLLEHQFEVGNIKVRRELAPDMVMVLGIEHQLQQVFLNLFLNARDAMPSGGWLSVVTRIDGDRAIAEIADTGSGIPSAHLARIYDPFFTTKSIGRGTGLGLSITYGIVREHDGTIRCDSAVGQGTRFTLALPLAPARSNQVRGVRH